VKAFFVLNPVEATTEKGDFEWDCQLSFCSLGTSNISPQIQTFTWEIWSFDLANCFFVQYAKAARLIA